MRALRCLLASLILLLAGPAEAEAVRVASGEHGDFTRLVVSGPGMAGWRLGRTDDGYGLALPGAPPVDLSQVFRLIGRERLSAIWVDPPTGLLRLRLDCLCHALVSQDPAGFIVIDLRDGAAPPGSVWEQPILGANLPELRSAPGIRPRPRPASLAILGPSWAGAVQAAARVDLGPAIPGVPVDNGSIGLAAALTEDLARGAARGLVDFAGRPPPQDGGGAGKVWPNLRSFDAARAGLRTGFGPSEALPLGAGGRPCPADQALDIGSWGDDRPIWQQIGEVQSELVGEFDQPDPEARARAVRFMLFAGYGLEARRMIAALPLSPGTPSDEGIWIAMAEILDGEDVTDPAFSGMAACNGRSAMWALLATPSSGGDLNANTAAVRRTFSELPRHLRNLLAPRLMDRLTALGDDDSAYEIKAAMTRGGDLPPPEAARAIADLALAEGDPAAALAATEAVPATGPGSALALAASVEAKVRLGQPVAADTAAALEALIAEHGGSAAGPDLLRALVLAEAASGDFSAAIAQLPQAPEAEDAVWDLLSRADDDRLLRHAVLAGQDIPKGIPPATRLAIASRLADLGLGPAALDWLGDMSADPVLAGRAALLAGDARAALRHLGGTEEDTATPIRRDAIGKLIRPGADMAALPTSPDLQLAAWASDWAWIAAHAEGPWQEVALTLQSGPAGDPATLAGGTAAVRSAEQARTAIARLLAEAPFP